MSLLTRSRCGAFLASTLLGPLLLLSAARAEVSKEYQLKAVLLYNLARFVEWPPEAFSAPDSPIIIGIMGRDPFGDVLDRVVQGEQVRDRKVRVERFPGSRDLRPCHILFIAATEKARTAEITNRLKGQPVLTVSDKSDFLRAGGMVWFYTNEASKVRVRLNLEAAKAEGLSISAKLIRVAELYRSSRLSPRTPFPSPRQEVLPVLLPAPGTAMGTASRLSCLHGT